MDLVTLKKKLSTYVTDGGQLRKVNEEVLFGVLIAWENWTGTAIEFYRSIGFSQKQMAGIIGKAKKLKREGHFGDGDFKRVQIDGNLAGPSTSPDPCNGIEIVWGGGRIIRFAQVDLLIDFLKNDLDLSQRTPTLTG